VNWGWFLVRSAIALTLLTALFLSQRFWYRSVWRATAKWRIVWLRAAVRLVYVALLVLIIGSAADGFRMGYRHHLIPGAKITMFAGLWFTSALFAYIAVKVVRVIERLWVSFRSVARRNAASSSSAAPATSNASAALATRPPAPPADLVPDLSRRYFFRTASALAGAVPFLSVVYGFAAERLDYRVRRVEIPTANLPPALDGMTIVQLSDIHLSGSMSRTDVRRAVDMANALGADLAVITGDFITGAADPLADCIDEIRCLRAPLGIFGCNGNHEIYAGAEDAAQELFAQAGMKLLRHENVQRFAAHISTFSALIISASAHIAASVWRCFPIWLPWFAGTCQTFFSPTIPTRLIVPRSWVLSYRWRGTLTAGKSRWKSSIIASAPRALSPITLPARTSARSPCPRQTSVRLRRQTIRRTASLSLPVMPSRPSQCSMLTADSALLALQCALAFRPKSRCSLCAAHSHPGVRTCSATYAFL
jgi:Calcineurin-like phosphoesterase